MTRNDGKTMADTGRRLTGKTAAGRRPAGLNFSGTGEYV